MDALRTLNFMQARPVRGEVLLLRELTVGAIPTDYAKLCLIP